MDVFSADLDRDRRRDDRAPLDALLNKYVDGYPYLGRAVNLSFGGLLVETVAPTAAREFFPVELDVPGQSPIWLWTRRVWTNGRREALRIVGIDRKDEAVLAKYLAIA